MMIQDRVVGDIQGKDFGQCFHGTISLPFDYLWCDKQNKLVLFDRQGVDRTNYTALAIYKERVLTWLAHFDERHNLDKSGVLNESLYHMQGKDCLQGVADSFHFVFGFQCLDMFDNVCDLAQLALYDNYDKYPESLIEALLSFALRDTENKVHDFGPLDSFYMLDKFLVQYTFDDDSCFYPFNSNYNAIPTTCQIKEILL
jgi:hypothetical protein